MPLPALGLLLGDPSGIGPELCAKLLSDKEPLWENRFAVLGEPSVLENGCKTAGIELEIPQVNHVGEIPEESFGMLKGPELDYGSVVVGHANEACGRYALDSFRRALGMCKSGDLDGFCFAPMNKESLRLGGNTHEDDLRFIGQGAGQAQALLLAARKAACRVRKPVPDLVQQPHAFEVEFGTILR